jgi:hypothetical protein
MNEFTLIIMLVISANVNGVKDTTDLVVKYSKLSYEECHDQLSGNYMRRILETSEEIKKIEALCVKTSEIAKTEWGIVCHKKGGCPVTQEDVKRNDDAFNSKVDEAIGWGLLSGRTEGVK